VFLAEHQLIERRVALKLLRAELARDADVLQRYMNDARAATALGHPNIVESTDMGLTREGVPYVVFEILEGTLLRDEIYRVQGLPVPRALRIAREIASALRVAHGAGLVHCGLESRTVFLTDRDGAADHVKVLDFGISRFIEAGMVIGSRPFMAPEQVTSPERVDGRSDVYALGAILYEMIAARRPFDGEDAEGLCSRICAEPPPALGVRGLPAGFEAMLVERFLAKRPEERFASMQEVEAALAAFADRVRPPGAESAPIPTVTARDPAAVGVVGLPPPPRRASVIWLAAALVAGAVGAVLLAADRDAYARGGCWVVAGGAGLAYLATRLRARRRR